MPGKGIATAIAVFGITGVGASELFMYPYWCTEKGYARWTGTQENNEAWRQRALGWIRVMNVDILASMVYLLPATVAFYFLGAGVLHAKGIVPTGTDMIVVLSRMYTETLGEWSVWALLHRRDCNALRHDLCGRPRATPAFSPTSRALLASSNAATTSAGPHSQSLHLVPLARP
jgi:hypothetical protein